MVGTRQVVTCALLAACGDDQAPPVKPCGSWRGGPALLDQREGSPAFLLDDHRVLLVGGHYRYSDGKAVDTSEIVDLEARTSTFSGSFSVPRWLSGQGPTTRLADGRVLTGSPWVPPGDPPLGGEVWNPSTGAWSAIAQQAVPTGQAVTLPDGRVLVAGGIDWSWQEQGVPDMPLARAEIWDGSGWTTVAPMSTPRTGHALVVVGGSAMAIGGFAQYPDGEGLRTTELYDTLADTWRAGPMTIEGRSATVAELSDGRVMWSGGTSTSGGNQVESASVEIFDPANGAWQSIAPMGRARAAHAATELADGRVIVTGGALNNFALTTSSGEIYDPVTNMWTEIARMSVARRHHAQLLLPHGDLFVAGGDPYGWFSSELYTPCE